MTGEAAATGPIRVPESAEEAPKKAKAAKKNKTKKEKKVMKSKAKKTKKATTGTHRHRESARTVEQPIRAGTVKAKLFQKISDGKIHETKELHNICDKNDKSRSLITAMFEAIRAVGYKVTVKDGTVQALRPKAKAAKAA